MLWCCNMTLQRMLCYRFYSGSGFSGLCPLSLYYLQRYHMIQAAHFVLLGWNERISEGTLNSWFCLRRLRVPSSLGTKVNFDDAVAPTGAGIGFRSWSAGCCLQKPIPHCPVSYAKLRAAWQGLITAAQLFEPNYVVDLMDVHRVFRRAGRGAAGFNLQFDANRMPLVIALDVFSKEINEWGRLPFQPKK